MVISRLSTRIRSNSPKIGSLAAESESTRADSELNRRVLKPWLKLGDFTFSVDVKFVPPVPDMHHHSPIILPLSLLALTVFLMGSCQIAILTENSVIQSMTKPDLRILVAVLTTEDRYERRQLIRLANTQQHGTYHDAEVDLRFVFCSLSKEEHSVLVQYNDIIILNCTENMNNQWKDL